MLAQAAGRRCGRSPGSFQQSLGGRPAGLGLTCCPGSCEMRSILLVRVVVSSSSCRKLADPTCRCSLWLLLHVFPFSFNFCVVIFFNNFKNYCYSVCAWVHRSSCMVRGQTCGAGSLCPPLQVTWLAGLQNRHRYQLSFLTGP